VYFTNRAAAYLKLQQYAQALQDTSKGVELDPNYQKGMQRHVEALIRCNRAEEASKIADKLFMNEQTSKNRELLIEAQRAAKLINSPTENFTVQMQQAIKNLLKLTAQATKLIIDFETPILSAQDR